MVVVDGGLFGFAGKAAAADGRSVNAPDVASVPRRGS